MALLRRALQACQAPQPSLCHLRTTPMLPALHSPPLFLCPRRRWVRQHSLTTCIMPLILRQLHAGLTFALAVVTAAMVLVTVTVAAAVVVVVVVVALKAALVPV
jgi:hypothetical protein